jgi:hypothetical protein
MLEKQQGLRDWMTKMSVKEAAITHDSWSTMLKDTYASLTFHFISEDFGLYSCPFDVKKLVGPTYAPCIADTVPTFIRLTEEEWAVIEMGVIVLQPLMAAQRHLEAELYVTNSLVVGQIHLI